MGLIYNPSESRKLMSNFRSNINTCEQIVADLKSGNRQLIRVLNRHQLSGSAFTAGQGLFTQLVIPTVSKADTVIQKLNSKLQQYGQYTGAAGGEILDEDKLNQQLEALRRQQATLSSQIRFYQNQARWSDEADITTMCYSYARSLTNFMGTIQEDIRQVEEKLKKLHELDMKLAPLFSGITSELSNLTAVISAIGSARFDSSGHFSMTYSETDLARMNKFLFAKGSKSESKKNHDNLDWKKIGKLIKGTASGTIISVTVSDVTLKIKASDLAKLKDILSKHKTGKFNYRGVSYFSKVGIKLKDFRCGKKSDFQFVRDLSKKLEKPLDKFQNTRLLKKATSKIPSYKHSTINRDLSSSKAIKSLNKLTGSGQTFKEASKLAKSFKVAGWVGTAVSVGSDYSELKSKGYSNGEATALTATHTAVSVAGASAGRAVGTYAGAIVGSIFPGAGTAVGAVVGGIIGSAIGGWFASKANERIDKSVKQNKKGLFGW